MFALELCMGAQHRPKHFFFLKSVLQVWQNPEFCNWFYKWGGNGCPLAQIRETENSNYSNFFFSTTDGAVFAVSLLDILLLF